MISGLVFAIDREREVTVTRVRRREFETHVNRLRDLSRILNAVFATEIDDVSTIPEQPFLLRLITQIDGDITLRRLNQMPSVRASR